MSRLKGVGDVRSLTVLSTVLVAVMIVATGTVAAQTDSDTSDVNLTVEETTIVTIEPGFYNFTSMSIQETNFSNMEQLKLLITNDGSTNITNVYAHLDTVSVEDSNPLGTGRSKEYAAGGFLFIKNDTSTMYHAGRLSWNITAAAGGTPSGVVDVDDNPKAHGFYRNATGDYLWSLSGNGTSTTNSFCNNTAGANDPEIYMKTVKDDGTNRDLNNNNVNYVLSDSNNDWSVGFASSGPLDGHFIAAHSTCEKFFIYRFDADSTFPTPSTKPNARYLVNNTLAPGQEFVGRVGAAVPSGTPAGITNITTMTVTASKE